MWEARKTRLYDSCPRLQSQHSVENLAETKGKSKGKSLLHINKSKPLLVGLAAGDNSSCMPVEDSSAHNCGCVVYGSCAMAAC